MGVTRSAAIDTGAAVRCCARRMIGSYGVGVNEAGAARPAGVAVIGTVISVSGVEANVAVGAVVPEAAAAPVSAVEAYAEVAEAVVDTAVVANVGAPVACVPEVAAVAVAPVAGGPESAGVGRCDPGARNPLVTVAGPCPVAGGPYIAIAGSGGLVVVRNWRGACCMS